MVIQMDVFDEIGSLFIEEGSGTLYMMKNNFVNTYKSILQQQYQRDTYNSARLSESDKKLLEDGLAEGFERFRCIFGKYSYFNDEVDSPSKTDLVNRCKGKTFRYNEIKLFNPYEKKQDYEQIDIEKHLKTNSIERNIDFYIGLVKQICESRSVIALDQRRLSMLCPSPVRSSLLSRAEIKPERLSSYPGVYD